MCSIVELRFARFDTVSCVNERSPELKYFVDGRLFDRIGVAKAPLSSLAISLPRMSDLYALFDGYADPPKKVRFAPQVQVYSDIPWSHAPLLLSRRSFTTDDAVDSLQNSSKVSMYDLRMEIKATEPTPAFGVVLLVVCLLILFCLIGFVVSRILLLEVDSEIGKQTNARKFQ
jgi:hypothetical protein